MATTVVQTATRLAEAWQVSRGAGAVVAIVDEDDSARYHPAFTGRVIATGVVLGHGGARDARTRAHGIQVAGLALGSGPPVTGLAPAAHLLPVVVPALSTVVGTREEAEALRWAADQGADVICCAWAPPRPTPERAKLPAHIRASIDYCLTRGRNGNGCVIVFSAGNDGSDLALNGYASHPGVITAGACNCHGKHPSYSGRGDALWCVFPSNDPRDPVGNSMTYLSAAPVRSLLHGEAYYTTRFGFTSAATAAVAGICALIVSANPSLTSTEVKAILRESCEKVDVESNTYDERGHSPLYGYGRPDVARAVDLARQRSTSAQKLGQPHHVETSMADLAVVSATAVRPVSGELQ